MSIKTEAGKPATDETRITLRLPKAVHAKIGQIAKGNGQSVNACIVQLLQEASSAYKRVEKTVMVVKYERK